MSSRSRNHWIHRPSAPLWQPHLLAGLSQGQERAQRPRRREQLQEVRVGLPPAAAGRVRARVQEALSLRRLRTLRTGKYLSQGHFTLLTNDRDDMNLLLQMIRISCHCNLVQLYVKCGEWNRGDVGNEEKERLACCQNQCPKTMKCGHR